MKLRDVIEGCNPAAIRPQPKQPDSSKQRSPYCRCNCRRFCWYSTISTAILNRFTRLQPPPRPAEQLHVSGWRWSQRCRVSVVQVATPVPRKSLSLVQIAALRARAVATTGQSWGSRKERSRASSSRAA